MEPFYRSGAVNSDRDVCIWRKRRGSEVPKHIDTFPPVPVDWQYTPSLLRQHRPALSIDAVMRIRTWERDRPLRELAAEYGVSHETIRKARNG